MLRTGFSLAAMLLTTNCAEQAMTSQSSTANTGTTLEGVTWGSCKSTAASGTTFASSYKSTISFISGVATSTYID
jgi:hypothetical protein